MPRVHYTKQSHGRGRSGDFPRLLAGRLALHFVNTVEAPASASPRDYLTDYIDLARWAWHAGILDARAVERMTLRARRKPEEATAVFRRAISLRRAIDRLFRAVVSAEEPVPADLATVHAEYTQGLTQARLVRRRDRYEWSWQPTDELASTLWDIARDAVGLLVDGDLDRVKRCPGAGDCGWLFYDTSRNGKRRWCSMEGCGSRVKMREYYARRAREAPPDAAATLRS